MILVSSGLIINGSFSSRNEMSKNNFSKLSLPFLIICLAAFLRLYELGRYSLWKDEIYSMLEAQRSIIQIFTTKTYFFGYAPLHHFFSHLALYFGKSEFILRLPAVIFGLATIFLIYKIGKLLFDAKVGLLASFLLSISVFHIDYTRQVRYYSYLIFFSTLTTFFLYKIIREKRWRWVILFFLTTLFNIATQATAFILFFTQVAFVLLWLYKKRIKNRPAFSIRAIAWNKKIKTNIFIIGAVLFFGTLFVKSFNELFAMLKFNPPSMSFDKFLISFLESLNGSKYILLINLFFFVFGLKLSLRDKKLEALLLSSILIIPVIILYFWRPAAFGFHIRYVSYIVIPYFLIIAYGAIYLLKRRILVALAILIFLALSYEPIYSYYLRRTGEWREVGEYLKQYAKPGDVIITETMENTWLIGYYYDSKLFNTILKAEKDPLINPLNYPFRRFYHQHNYVKNGNPDPEEIPVFDYQEIVPFDPNAEISPMYIFVTRPIWIWQEAETEPFKNEGWYLSDSWGKKTMGVDSLFFPNAQISYKFNIPESGNYDLYANLRWDGARGVLKYKFDNEKWSNGFQPFYGEKGDVIYKWRWKEIKFGSYFLKSGEHQITFLNEKTKDEVDRYQAIDYFYFTLNGEK